MPLTPPLPPASSASPEIPELPAASPQAPRARRAPRAKIRTEFRTIYGSAPGKSQDWNRLTIAREHRARKLLISLIIFFALAAAAAWAGFLVFKPFGAFEGGGVGFSFKAPEHLAAGGSAEITVEYTNRERVPLGTVELALTPPAGFLITGTEPAADGRRWHIGALKPHETSAVHVRGIVSAAPGTELVFQVFATYIPANFNSEFQSVDAYRAVVDGSVLSLTPEAPAEAIQGDTVPWKLKVENKGTDPVDSVALYADPPATFVTDRSEPSSAESGRWRLGVLPAGAATSVALFGSFSGDARGEVPLVARVGRLADGLFASYATATATVRVAGGELKTTLLVNGSAEAQPVNFGDTLRISLVYKNEGAEALKDVELALSATASPRQGETTVLDWSAFESEPAGSREGTRITWTKRVVPAFRSLAPGAEGTIDFTVPLRNQPFTLDDRNYLVTLMVETRVGSIGSRRVDRSVRSAALEFPVLSDAALSAAARYYDDDEVAVGSGPLPPKIGEATTYRMFWKVTNSLHELTNLTIAAPLPDGVNWTNHTHASAGTVTYDPERRMVIWTLNRLPSSIPEVSADFDVSAIPQNTFAGTVMPLLGRTTLDADDAALGKHLVRASDALDSSLEGDPVAEGKGVVLK